MAYCDSLLAENQSDFDLLMFRGFASFYEGILRVNYEERLPFIDDSIFHLRKAILFDEKKMRPQIYYVLGRAYYHKGRYYCDQSIKYLEKAVAENYIGKDTWEYLALNYVELGNKKKSVECFEKAAEINPSDILFSMLAQIYMDLQSFNLAEEYLLKSNNKTDNPVIKEKNFFLLGQFYENKKDFTKAMECYQNIISNNSRSADAYYRLGLLYELAGDKIKARAEWRKALRVNPQHYSTKLKLYG
jgi:tetratricopeptide (TPR) repeat protein